MAISWTSDLDTGIDVIDKQHQQIVVYINELEDAQNRKDNALVSKVLFELVDYTMSHFAFEESLQEEAGYKFCKPHKRIHDLFVKRVGEYVTRFKLGEDIIDEVHTMLVYWLIHHIKSDDADYVAAVKANMQEVISAKEKAKDDGGWFKRFFK